MSHENRTEVEDSFNGYQQFPFLVRESEESFYHGVYRSMYEADHNSTNVGISLSSFSATHVKWISAIVVCVAVVVYFCFMTAWGRHKKKQNQEGLLNRRQEALAPFQLYSAICMSAQQLRPPSYAQATGLYDLPPAYEVVAAAQLEKTTSPQGCVNVALDTEEDDRRAGGSAGGEFNNPCGTKTGATQQTNSPTDGTDCELSRQPVDVSVNQVTG